MAADRHDDSREVPAWQGVAEWAPPPGHIAWEAAESVDDCSPVGVVRLRAVVPFAALPDDAPRCADDREEQQLHLLDRALTAALAAFMEVWLPQAVKDRRAAAAAAYAAEAPDELFDGLPF